MNSEEIRSRLIHDMPGTIQFSEMLVWLKEIAYQLALKNELATQNDLIRSHGAVLQDGLLKAKMEPAAIADYEKEQNR